MTLPFVDAQCDPCFIFHDTLRSDVVKTRMQSFPEKYNKGVLAAARDIVKEEGMAYLLTGLGPTVVGYGLEGALKFGCYESFKVIFQHLTPYKVFNFLMASVVAGAVASIVLVSVTLRSDGYPQLLVTLFDCLRSFVFV